MSHITKKGTTWCFFSKMKVVYSQNVPWWTLLKMHTQSNEPYGKTHTQSQSHQIKEIIMNEKWTIW